MSLVTGGEDVVKNACVNNCSTRAKITSHTLRYFKVLIYGGTSIFYVDSTQAMESNKD